MSAKFKIFKNLFANRCLHLTILAETAKEMAKVQLRAF